MEVGGMEEAKNADKQSAVAFVEGGIQDARDDACSICLEEYSESDPSTVTNCMHDFHLQCILEWCQRSSQCPMCWQDISLKNSTSQELLEAVERERHFAAPPSRNAAVFHYPMLGDFELPHLPVGASIPDLEERIFQHLEAAAAIGRSRRTGTIEGHRSRLSAHVCPHLLVYAAHPDSANLAPTSSPLTLTAEESEPDGIAVANPSSSHSFGGSESSRLDSKFPSRQNSYSPSFASRSCARSLHRRGSSLSNRCTSSISCMSNQEKARPSELQTISESLKSRFNAVSTRYKESISKSTRGWKERLFSRTSSMSALGSDTQIEGNTGISSESRRMQQLKTQGNNLAHEASVLGESSVTEQNNQQNT